MFSEVETAAQSPQFVESVAGPSVFGEVEAAARKNASTSDMAIYERLLCNKWKLSDEQFLALLQFTVEHADDVHLGSNRAVILRNPLFAGKDDNWVRRMSVERIPALPEEFLRRYIDEESVEKIKSIVHQKDRQER